MARLTTLGRAFFAIALIGLGIEHFIFRAFVTGRAPAWPASAPGGAAWAYLTGIGFIVIGISVILGNISIILGKRARLAAVLASALILGWALLRHIPVVAADSFLGPTWTPAGKALTFCGGALAIAATLPTVEGSRALWKFINLKQEFITLGRISLGTFLIIAGIQHYLFTEFVASLVPAWIPGTGVFWTYLAGAALIASGMGLYVPRTARLAALLSGSMVFSWFWIVHLPKTFDGVSAAIAVFEALAVSGIAFVLAAYSSDEHKASLQSSSREDRPLSGHESGVH